MSQGGAFRKLATTFIANDASTAIPVDNGLGSDLNIIGTGVITTTASGNTVTISSSGASSTTFTCDSGSAVPAANNLNVIGGGGAATSGSGSTVTVSVPLSPFQFGGNASAHEVNTTTGFAPVTYVDFGSLEMRTRNFNTTTTEYMEGNFLVPSDLDATGTVTFKLIGSSATALADKNVKFTFDFLQLAADGLLSGSYGDAQVWDDQPVSADQDDQDIISNTATVSTLGWVAGRQVYYRVYRSTATTNNLGTDYRLLSFIGLIPRS